MDHGMQTDASDTNDQTCWDSPVTRAIRTSLFPPFSPFRLLTLPPHTTWQHPVAAASLLLTTKLPTTVPPPRLVHRSTPEASLGPTCTMALPGWSIPDFSTTDADDWGALPPSTPFAGEPDALRCT